MTQHNNKKPRFKRGQIFLNRWAGYKNLFVYLNANGQYAYGISIITINGEIKIQKAIYYKHDLSDTEHFPVVGFIDIRTMWLTALENGLTDTKQIDAEYDTKTGHKKLPVKKN